MRKLVAATWLPTVVFMALSRFAAWDPGSGLIHRHGPTVLALVLVQLTWQSYVMRGGRPRIWRAALAGATSGFFVPTAATGLGQIWYYAQPHRYVDGFGRGIDGFLTFFMIGLWLLIGAPVGAGTGALVAFVQRIWMNDPSVDAARSPSGVDGALAGAMVATLTSPVVMLLVAALVAPIRPSLPQSLQNLGVLLLGTWLVWIPFGAWAGTWGVRPAGRVGDQAAT